jgi:hypothetical protein
MLRIRDPGSGAFLPPRSGSGSGIRDGAMVGSGSGIRDKQTKFVNSLYKKEVGSGIRCPVLFYPPELPKLTKLPKDPGSGIKHPGSATLPSGSGIREPEKFIPDPDPGSRG